MAIKFTHVGTEDRPGSGEIIVCDSEPKISAFWNSSDMGPNAMAGQNLGWKLAPEVVVEMRRIKRNPQVLQTLANNMRKSLDEIKDTDILKMISDHTSVEDAPSAIMENYNNNYQNQIKTLENKIVEDVDTKLESAKIEAEELGIDIEPYDDNYGLIKAAIARYKKANSIG